MYVCDVVEVQCHIVDDFCMQLRKAYIQYMAERSLNQLLLVDSAT